MLIVNIGLYALAVGLGVFATVVLWKFFRSFSIPAQDDDPAVRAEAAADRNLSQKLMKMLSRDMDLGVLEGVSFQPCTT